MYMNFCWVDLLLYGILHLYKYSWKRFTYICSIRNYSIIILLLRACRSHRTVSCHIKSVAAHIILDDTCPPSLTAICSLSAVVMRLKYTNLCHATDVHNERGIADDGPSGGFGLILASSCVEDHVVVFEYSGKSIVLCTLRWCARVILLVKQCIMRRYYAHFSEVACMMPDPPA